MSPAIYLDYQATTPVDPRVLEAMLPYFSERFANPASVQHDAGRSAAEAVEHAREQIAGLLGADRREVVFCSGATEANNLALKGLAEDAERRHLVVLATEHHAVLDTAHSLARRGFEITELPVDSEGQPSLSALEEAIDENTLLVSIAAANNEIGTLPPLAAVADIAHARGALLHTDAAQAAGKVDLDLKRDGIDLLSLSSHKMYGPKGVGALVVAREHQRPLSPLIHGGGHERGLRSGTLNVPGIVGFGVAANLTMAEGGEEAERLRALATRFYEGLRVEIGEVELNGPIEPRLPGNVNLRFLGIDVEALMANCPELCFSAGSACSAATPTPSHVLRAIGLSQDGAEQSARFGFGRPTSAAEVDRAIEVLASAVSRIRGAADKQPIGVR